MLLFQRVNINNPIFVAEVIRLQRGLQLAINEGLKNIKIEGEDLFVINVVIGISSPSQQIANIIQDIKVLLARFDNWKIKHIYRETNRAANRIANVCYLVTFSILVNDVLGVSLVQRATQKPFSYLLCLTILFILTI